MNAGFKLRDKAVMNIEVGFYNGWILLTAETIGIVSFTI
jgi:hypothetical protein